MQLVIVPWEILSIAMIRHWGVSKDCFDMKKGKRAKRWWKKKIKNQAKFQIHLGENWVTGTFWIFDPSPQPIYRPQDKTSNLKIPITKPSPILEKHMKFWDGCWVELWTLVILCLEREREQEKKLQSVFTHIITYHESK